MQTERLETAYTNEVVTMQELQNSREVQNSFGTSCYKSTPKRPVLRYHGGKWLLAPWIISHFPRHRIYTEAYGGAASVLLRKPRIFSETYNDLDGEIFRVLPD